jgi:hypothetical protein
VLTIKTTRRAAAARALALAGAAVCLLGAGGCGYTVRTPFNTEFKTVFVSIKSITFRREVQLQLAELVTKEIEKRTPYKVVGKPEGADTILDATINFADKNLIVENPFNYPRQLQATLNCSVNWYHNPPTAEELERTPTVVVENINFVPEVGETSMTAFYQANQSLAQQIAGMMETPW